VQEGIEVLAVDIARTPFEELEEMGVEAIVANVADHADCDRIAVASADCNYLVNAAGIIRIKPLFEVTEQEWREIMSINAESVFFLCQKVGPKMAAGGCIANLSFASAKVCDDD
jgi:NAD(P)-dependent dehydrogenase (short-subunit alcohol dehydrogenase family)